MKRISIILASLALVCGCTLEEYPYGFYSENNFYKTAADAESAINYVYDAITYIEYSRAIVFLGDMNTDVMTPKGDATAATKELDGWKMATFKTNTTLYNFYKYSYITINRANSVIENVPKMDIDQALKDRCVGEAYFMRAYSYYCLARNFGRVPIHLKPTRTLDDTTVAPAESLDQLWAQIFSDLENAESLMQVNAAPRPGRTDKVAALSLMAKAYLYLASAKESGAPFYKDMNFGVEDYYQKSVQAAAKVVADPSQTTYHFDSDLMAIYDVEKSDGPEHIFIMSMDRTGETEGQYSKISKMYIPYISGGTIYLKQGDTDVLIKSHDGWSEYQTAADFWNSFEAGDRRHDWLFCDKVYDVNGNLLASYPGNKLSYPFCRKFIDPDYSGDKTSTKPMLIRFSDIALVYAEAAGPTEKAYELVNFIRSRAGLSPLSAGLSKEAFRAAVQKERTYELAFEGDLCYDLRRQNKLHTNITEAKGQGWTAEDMVFYPIPSLETDLNPYIK
ncbi:MAG: RagB/SusD family nutrient uptake outer membrane protein [Bacteroidales bacterium]|nr:RagB/SusD family nutrient uptake outer membrane protein [Bacteroidales bacterium]